MPKRYTVAAGQEFNYPADAASEKTIRGAGGCSKLTEAQRATVKFKTVKEGEDCSDMPASSLEIYVERGWVLETGVELTPVLPLQADEFDEDGGAE
jgi:hypothetical protein